MRNRKKHSSKHLEVEKETFTGTMVSVVDSVDFQEEYKEGRPPISRRDILKALLIMSYHSWSYRRAQTDIRDLYKKELMIKNPNRPSMNRCMNDQKFKNQLQKLIEFTGSYLMENEDTIIFDSTGFSKMLRLSASNMKYSPHRNTRLPPLSKTRKLHVVIGKNSKAIICARTSIGTVHDSQYFKELFNNIIIEQKYPIKIILADSAYNSKEYFDLCEEHKIEAFFDFKSNHVIGRSGSFLRKRQFNLYHDKPQQWHKTYNARTLIEIVFSAIKRKGKNYLRSRTEVAQDNEMLLKALWYNLCLIAKLKNTNPYLY